MDASSGQLQEMQNHSLENVLESSKTQQQDRKPIKPEPEQALKCPRCESTNTKFCYYNNYSLSQPRYFCKSCRRYWTKGGTLRNVPVGGGCRKNKRSSSSSQKAYQSFETNPSNPLTGLQTLGLGYDHSNDLALAFARLQQRQSQDHDPLSAFGHQYNNTTTTQCNDILGNHNVHTHTGFFDALRSGYMDNQNGFRNLYNLGDVDSSSAEILLPSDQEFSNSVATMKQEICDVGRGHHDNRVLYGFPWQLNAAGDGNMSQDVAASSWHGLVNSPLM